MDRQPESSEAALRDSMGDSDAAKVEQAAKEVASDAANVEQAAKEVASDTAKIEQAAKQVAGDPAKVARAAKQVASRLLTVDREEFTGLPIEKRCMDKAAWSQQIRGANRRIVPFSRITDLQGVGRAQQDCDRVLIAVLYDRPKSDSFTNGDKYQTWYLSDLGAPRPRRLCLQLRFQAFSEWSKKKDILRGSILAVMNPFLASVGSGTTGNTLPCLRIDKSAQMVKLGDCPALGLCQVKACKQPINIENKERVCAIHLGQMYADKSGRMSVSGGANISGLLGVKGKSGRPAPKQMPPPAMDLVNPETIEMDKKEEVMRRTEAKLRVEERRFNTSEANEQYVRALRRGESFEKSEWSRVPLLGRGLNEDGTELELDLDMDTDQQTEQEELSKMERMMQKRALRAELKAVAGGKQKMKEEDEGTSCTHEAFASLFGSSDASSKQKRQREDDGAQEQAPKKARPERSLKDLLDTKTTKLAVRARAVASRAGAERNTATSPSAESASSGSTSAATPAPVSSSNATVMMTPAAAASEVSECDKEIASRAQELVNNVPLGGDNRQRFQEFLAAADSLPKRVWSLEVGHRLYHAFGQLIISLAAEDLKRQAMAARRRWRLENSSQLASAAVPSKVNSAVEGETVADGGETATSESKLSSVASAVVVASDGGA